MRDTESLNVRLNVTVLVNISEAVTVSATPFVLPSTIISLLIVMLSGLGLTLKLIYAASDVPIDSYSLRFFESYIGATIASPNI